MVKLSDLLQRSIPPAPWSEAENIPWSEPGFSERMLREHLDQSHDLASRRAGRIDAHVRWLHTVVLAGKPGRVLDLACGPGLYTSRLASLGHECLGIDWSPASIAYARERAGKSAACRYVEADIRQADYGAGYDLITFVYGEFNSLRRTDAALVLGRACEALSAGGHLVVEAHSFEAVRRIAERPTSWYTSNGGLFSERPHLVLRESFWDESARAATERYFVVDLEDASVERYATSAQAYRDDEVRALFAEGGFGAIELLPGMGEDDAEGARKDGLLAILARV